MSDQLPLTRFEKDVLHRCIASAKQSEWRPQLEIQLRHARIADRTEKTVGYYIDFDVPDELHIADMPDESNKAPMETSATHPDGKNAIFFILYVKNGKLNFLESSSTSDWPQDEDAIRFNEPTSPG